MEVPIPPGLTTDFLRACIQNAIGSQGNDAPKTIVSAGVPEAPKTNATIDRIQHK